MKSIQAELCSRNPNNTAAKRQEYRGRISLHAVTIACLTGLLGAGPASLALAQDAAEELFTTVPQTQVAAFAPAQSLRIEQIRNRRTTESAEFVRVNQNALRANQLRISVPGRAPITLSKRSGETRNGSVVAWSGEEQGKGPGGASATLIVEDNEVTGSIKAPGALFRLLPVGGAVHALVKVDTRKLPPDHQPDGIQQAVDILPLYGRDDEVETADTGPAQIDVLVAYTPTAAAAASMRSTIALAIKEANDSYVNSVVNLRLKLVDSFQLSFSEAGKSYATLVSEFKNNATVNQRRNSSGADIAVLIVDQNAACGRADAIMATAASAYAVVHYDCATGYYSFAHELGHLMGARHNQQEDSTATP
jgi:hypothetical protein